MTRFFVLKVKVQLADELGDTSPRSLSDIYIFSPENGIGDRYDDSYQYYAARVPPAELEYMELRTLIDYSSVKEITTPHVRFMHKPSDGVEICVARAIIALEEAGMNV